MKKITAVLLIMIMAVTLLTGCGGKESGGEKGTLYVYCFGDYFDPDLQYEFEEQTGIDLTAITDLIFFWPESEK